MVLLLMKKRTLFSKIQAVRAHKVKLDSWAFQLLLQALVHTYKAFIRTDYSFYCLGQRNM